MIIQQQQWPGAAVTRACVPTTGPCVCSVCRPHGERWLASVASMCTAPHLPSLRNEAQPSTQCSGPTLVGSAGGGHKHHSSQVRNIETLTTTVHGCSLSGSCQELPSTVSPSILIPTTLTAGVGLSEQSCMQTNSQRQGVRNSVGGD